MTYAEKAGPALRAVRYAVATGRLVKAPCVECGSEDVQAHHVNGYDLEHHLDIVWLCRPHHRARHGRAYLPWERGYRAYLAATRPRFATEVYTFSDQSGPKHLALTIERVWSLLRTDEERAYVAAFMDRLTDKLATAR